MTLIKICGVTLPDDAARVAASGADFVGFNFWPRSKRHLPPDRLQLLAGIARSSGPVKLVGVFVDPHVDEVLAVAAELDAIQLHGDESPELCAQLAAATKLPIWKALPIASARDVEPLHVWPVDVLLLDAPTPGRGGAGAKFDHQHAVVARQKHPARRFVLAGGLTPATVAAAIALVQPWAVDVASGVEVAPGIKDAAKLAAFVSAVHSR